MLDKKFIFLVILLVGFISISSVSALDDAASNNSILDESIDDIGALSSSDEELISDENDDGDVLSKADGEAELSEDPGNFYDLYQAINGNDDSTIELTRDYVFGDSGSQLDRGIVINRSVTINGNGITIDGSNKARIFNITADNVIINNITFKNGNATGSYAGEDIYGGAIYWSGADGSAVNCIFNNNYAFQNGGAIYWSGADGSAVNCSFNDNSAFYYGGAIYGGSAVNCNFTGNSASWGGAICYEYEPGYGFDYDDFCHAVNCNFNDNSASTYGGAVYHCIAENCNFTGNIADDGYGGAICHGIAENCIFISNSADDGGGAAYEVKAKNCNFTNNSASNGETGDGGAILGGSAVNCIFTNNSADRVGGAIAYGSAENSAFNNNYVTCEYSCGGAIYDGDAVNCNFTGNSAYNGGAIGSDSYDTSCSAKNCIFTGNNALADGGAIYDGSAENCIFKSNSAAQNGGAMIYGSAKNCTFTGNSAINGSDICNGTLTYYTKVTAPKVTATYNVNKYLVITLKDSFGKALAKQKVTVKVGTISKTLITNSKGQVSVLVSKLIPKTYTASISFAGDKTYLKSSSSVKVVVKKATPKLTAKAKTFKRTVKTKKYKITLKTNKGKVMKKVKVTLRVNKKTFTAKTNSKGVATFKITNLKKKGKYTAVVKYAGNKYYKKVTKKPKITVKV